MDSTGNLHKAVAYNGFAELYLLTPGLPRRISMASVLARVVLR